MHRHTNEPHDRNARPPRDPQWMRDASQSVAADLRAFAARYPDRFEYRDGKLVTRRPEPRTT